MSDSYPEDTAIGPIVVNPDFVVCKKPAGLETVSQEGGRDFLSLAKAQLQRPELLPVHRLDRDTSGSLVFALNPEAERELTALFRRREVEKTYLALCLGAPWNRYGVVRRNLSEWSGGRRPIREIKGGGGLAAATAYRVLGQSREFLEGETAFRAGLLAFNPREGRTHQIRVHAASLSCPILGDDNYGDRAANRAAKRLLGLRRSALHAWRLAFPWRGGRIEAYCPLPDELAEAFTVAFPGGAWERALAGVAGDL